MNRAIFLDRDGILIEDVSYPHKLNDLHIKEDILPHLRWAQKEGFLLIIITNQAGVAKGKFTLEQYHAFQKKLLTDLNELGVVIDDTYFCPYHKDGIVKEYAIESYDRKPNPGMIIKALEKFNIDITKSYMIGDKFSDNIDLQGLRSFILESQYTRDLEGNCYKDFDSIFKEIKGAI